ncbi:hypothetical protein DXB18_10995 [Clostridium sp. OM02-18AC]|nr:hypothetical protein DXB18_10995 [Clostridium sp. OM02-18AC]
MRNHETIKQGIPEEKNRKSWNSHLETIVLNINKGHNVALMEKCRELHDYSTFVALVREKQKSGLPLVLAVNDAMEECIKNDVLADFLRKNRAEVLKVSIYEYDEERNYQLLQKQYRNAGLAEGREAGLAEGHKAGLEEGQLLEQVRLIVKKMQKNDSVLRIAETLELDEAFVQLICQIAKQMAPDYDVEKVMELYQKKNMGSDEQ